MADYYSNLYYNANGGTGGPSNNLDTKSAQTTPTARSITIPSTIPTRENYIFKGWSKTSGGSVEYNIGDTISVPYLTTDTGITLFAVYEKKKVFKPCFYVGNTKVGIRNINKKIVIGE